MTARLPVRAVVSAAHEYDVIVRAGAASGIAELLDEVVPDTPCVVITPDTLRDSHAARVADQLRTSGRTVLLLDFPDGEAHKTREVWSALTDRMLEHELGRDCCVVAVGGGVTGDVAGFVAATYMRGVAFVQVPTTLLAMIDASVGGKTGVDTTVGKNLVGAFHPPRIVVIDPLFLTTLPLDQLRAGLAEAIKHGAILDAAYFDWISEHVTDVLARDAAALEYLIARSVELKAQVVSEDPLEAGRRAILNFGHTVGHALEHVSSYALPHGFAVAAGMHIEAALGAAAGITDAGAASRIAALLDAAGLPAHAPGTERAVADAMRIDKKSRHRRPRFVLLRDIGECARNADGRWTHEVADDVLMTVLRSALVAPGLV